MAWTYPLSLADFYDKLRVSIGNRNWELQRFDQVSGLGSGQPLTAELASPLWTLPVQLVPMPNAEAEPILTMLEMLTHPGRAFYFSNPKREYPVSDPDGNALLALTTLHTSRPWNDTFTWSDSMNWGGSLPTANIAIAGLSGNNQVSFSGLPPGYTLTAGDMFSFDYGPPLQPRRAMHRITETVTASSGGVTPLAEVFPFIRTGAAVGNSVSIAKPAILASLVPGTLNSGVADTVNTSGISFTIIQRLR